MALLIANNVNTRQVNKCGKISKKWHLFLYLQIYLSYATTIRTYTNRSGTFGAATPSGVAFHIPICCYIDIRALTIYHY